MDESKLLSDEELREISELDDAVDVGPLRGVATGVVAEHQEQNEKTPIPESFDEKAHFDFMMSLL